MATVNTTFVSEKISKVCWIHEQLIESERFLSGSYDMSKNFVRAWRLQKIFSLDRENKYVPRCTDKLAMNGDVMGLKMLSENEAIVACSDGRLSLLKVKKCADVDLLHTKDQTKVLHQFESSGRSASCNAISVYGQEVATVGEDGCLNIIDTFGSQLTERRHINADSCSLMSVLYVNHEEVLTGNRMGVIRMFDIRSYESECMSTAAFMTACEDERNCNYVSCLTSHPTQPHIVFAGSEEGSITVWDLRKPGFPAAYLKAHDSPISDIGFHRSDPSKFISASESGQLWLWKPNPTLEPLDKLGLEIPSVSDNSIPWLDGERAKSRIGVTAIFSNLSKAINSFDTQGSKILCGSDSEAFYIVNNIH